MGIETDLNVSPYYDDFDETKNYHKVLFKPAVALQARELTQLQTILQNQVERFGQHIFKEGSIVQGCTFNFNSSVDYLKILDKTIAGTDVNVALISEGDYLRGQTANLVSRVVDRAGGLETQNPDLNTLFFNYISSDNAVTKYSNGEIIEVYPAATGLANIQVTNNGTSGYSNSDTVTITSSNGGNATANVITNNTGAVTSINVTANGTGFTADDYPTATITSANASANGATLRVNLQETMRVTAANSSFFDAGGNTQFNITGKSFQMSVGDGVMFQKGIFQRFAEQTIIVSKYTNKPHELAVGAQTLESTVNNSVDTSLLDNAAGFNNENAPGADRLKLEPTLVVNTVSNATSSNNFLKLAEFNFGTVIGKSQGAQLNSLGDQMAKRTYEESGDYVVEPFGLTTEERVGDANNTTVMVGAGIGYIQGNRFELAGATRIALPRATTTQTATSQSVSINYGSYVEVDELVGEFGEVNNDLVLIMDGAFNAISGTTNGANSSLSAASNTAVTYDGVTSSVVGTARVRSLEQQGDLPGGSNNKYKLYLYDIKMSTGFSFNKHAKSIWHYKGGSEYTVAGYQTNVAVSGVADIVLDGNSLAEIKDASFNKLVFPIGQKGVSAVNANGNYTFRRKQTLTFSTGGTGFIDLSDANQTFGYGNTGDLNETQEKELILIPQENGTGSAAESTNADVNGTSTPIVTSCSTTNLRVGDHVKIDTKIRQITGIISATSFVVSQNVGVDHNSNGTVTRFFPKHYPLSLHNRDDAKGTASNSGQRLTINIDRALTAQMNCSVTHNVVDTSEAGKTKSLSTTEMSILTVNNAGIYTGPWTLGVPDALSLVEVCVSNSGSNTVANSTVYNTATGYGTNVTENFEIITGQKDGFYGLSSLKIKPDSGYSLSAGMNLAVKFKHFTESGSGFFSYQSYNTMISGEDITIQEIPIFASPQDGTEISLRDSIDFRPQVATTANVGATFAAGGTSHTLNPIATETFSNASLLSAPNKTWSSNVTYYLPRKDRLVIEGSGVRIVQGQPSVNPQLPDIPPLAMQLGTIDVPVFPTLSAQGGKFYKRPDLAVKIRATQLKRYTMRDIRKIDDRVNNLEYYSSLNLLETNTKDSVLPGKTNATLNRFKNGFIVDNFASLTNGNILNNEHKAGIDEARKLLTSKFEKYHVELKYESGANITQHGDHITPRYQQNLLLQQNKASTSRRLTSQYWKYNGTVKLFPDYLSRVDETVVPEQAMQIDVDVASGTLALLDSLNKAMPSQFTSDEVIDEEADTRLTSTTETDTTRTDTFETIITQNIRRTTNTVSGETATTKRKVGEFMTSLAFQPYIPGTQIRFVATGLRPGLRHYIFFDEVNVNEHVTPSELRNYSTNEKALSTLSTTIARSRIYRGKRLGSALTANSTGSVAGILSIPSSTFFAGERKFVIADVDNLAQIKDAVSAATARFNCYNFSVNTAEIHQTTRSPVLSSSQSSRIITEKSDPTTSQVVTTLPPPPQTNTVANTIPGTGNGDIIPVTNTGITNAAANTFWPGRPIVDFEVCPEFITARGDSRFTSLQGNTFDNFDDCVDDDPLCQTFMLSPSMFGGSQTGFLTSVDLYFDEKDPNQGVTIELRETENGMPASGAICNVVLESSDINTSSKGTVATTITWPYPISVDSSREYAIVIKPGANSPEYKLFTTKAGDKDLSTNITTNQDWGKGTMFLSTNDRTWKAYLDEDIKFTVYGAYFSDNVSTVDLVNEDYEWLVANNGVVNGTFSQGEEIFKLAANAAGTIAVNEGNSIIIGTGTNFTSPAIASGDKIVLSGNTTVFDIVTVNSVSNSTHLVVRGGPTFTDSSANYMQTPSAIYTQLSKELTSPGVVTNTIMVQDSTAANSNYLFANQDTIVGVSSGANCVIDAPVNNFISYHEPRLYNTVLPKTLITSKLQGRNLADNAFTELETIKSNDRNYPSEPTQIKSKSNEISGATLTKSLRVRHILSSPHRFAAPSVDLQAQGILQYENIINNVDTNEHLTNTGEALAKYVSRTVTLADGLDAEDVKVFVTGYRPSGTDIKVYAKILNQADASIIDDTNWSPLQMTSNEFKFSSDKERGDTNEYGFEFLDRPSSTTVKAGTVTYHTDASNNTIITGSGTAFSSDYAAGDTILLEGSFNDGNDYTVSKVAAVANNTQLTISDAVQSIETTGKPHFKVDSVSLNEAFRDPQATVPGQVTYYNSAGEKFVGYQKLAIKIVMKSESTSKAPVLHDFRAIAVSL